jgi:hypothetical protein
MKFNHIYLAALLPVGSLLFCSCDGGSDGEEDLTVEERDLLRAESLSSQEISQGDEIRWTPSPESGQQATVVTFGPAGDTALGTTTYDYTKAGEFIFNVVERPTTDPQQSLDRALLNTLSGQTGTESPLDSRLRELLHRDTDNFTTDELDEIASILNPSGANLSLSSSGGLIRTTSSTFFNEVTSTRGDQRRGSMGGRYFVESDVLDVDFREPTSSERAILRFFDGDNLIPFINETSFRTAERTEEGTWSLRLVNQID